MAWKKKERKIKIQNYKTTNLKKQKGNRDISNEKQKGKNT